MLKKNRLIAIVGAVFAAGMVIAIEGNASYASSGFCKEAEAGSPAYTKNVFHRTVLPAADGSTVYSFVHNGILPGSRNLCSIVVVDGQVVKTIKSDAWIGGEVVKTPKSPAWGYSANKPAH